MGKVQDEITEKDAAFIASQKVFFVATAALSGDHHVSLSPKSPGASCVVLDNYTVAYADLTGSGAETAAHILQNGRMTLMFCNIESGPPKILRLFGKAHVIMAQDAPPTLKSKFPKSITDSVGFRAIYKLNVSRISTSCGYSMPVMEFKSFRKMLDEFTEKRGKDGMFEYTTTKNSFSIDGLPSLGLLRKNGPKNVVPVAEDGYILGKVGSSSINVTSNQFNALDEARKMHAAASKRISLRLVHVPLASVVIFVAGLVTGTLASHHL